jgi:two-component system sensor histidine kinase PilS (NtrC family)
MVAPRIQRIRKGLGNVERTVHDFLNYATPIRQQPSLVDLTEVVEPVCAEIRAQPDQLPVELECLVVPGLHAWCDPHALRQILSNLLNNGLQAQHRGALPRRLRVEAARNGAWIDLLVDDAGPGVAGEAHHKIFDCFFTTHSEGTGLGLPIARRLAEMNGGGLELMAEPSPLGGARFRLHLPARPHRRGLDSGQP